jgi:hypothetical protein
MGVQIMILINGKAYGTADKASFDEEQKDHIEGVKMCLESADFKMGKENRTIEGTLADNRTIAIEIVIFNDKVLYAASTEEPYVEVTEEKNIREAGATPVYVKRPEQKVEEIHITGLINCIGVIIEVVDKHDGKVAGAAGGHFVTPEMLENTKGELTKEGLTFIGNILKLVDAQEGEKRFSLHFSGDADSSTKMALAVLNGKFNIKGYKNMSANKGPSEITYSLNHEGYSSIR